MKQKESSMCKVSARLQHVMEPGAWNKVELLADLGRGVSINKERLREKKIVRKVKLPGVGQGIERGFESAEGTSGLKERRIMR